MALNMKNRNHEVLSYKLLLKRKKQLEQSLSKSNRTNDKVKQLGRDYLKPIGLISFLWAKFKFKLGFSMSWHKLELAYTLTQSNGTPLEEGCVPALYNQMVLEKVFVRDFRGQGDKSDKQKSSIKKKAGRFEKLYQAAFDHNVVDKALALSSVEMSSFHTDLGCQENSLKDGDPSSDLDVRFRDPAFTIGFIATGGAVHLDLSKGQGSEPEGSGERQFQEIYGR